jgi:hypothetical protein
MKKTLLTLGLVALSVAAFAQGRVNVLNDAPSPVQLDPTGLLMSADQGMAGQSVSTPLPSGITLMAGLYGGTSQGTLFLYSTWLLSAAIPAGSIPATHVVLNANATAPAIPGIATGTPFGPNTPWFQVRLWDSAFPNYQAALQAGAYISDLTRGAGQEFQLNPSPSAIAYTGTTPPGPNSGWIDGPILVQLAPEPSTFALVGLGVAGMMIFRRRK